MILDLENEHKLKAAFFKAPQQNKKAGPQRPGLTRLMN